MENSAFSLAYLLWRVGLTQENVGGPSGQIAEAQRLGAGDLTLWRASGISSCYVGKY